MRFKHLPTLKALFVVTATILSTCNGPLTGPPGSDGSNGQPGTPGPTGPQGPPGASGFQDGTTVVHIFLSSADDGFSTPIGYYNLKRQEPCIWRAINGLSHCAPSTEIGYFLYTDQSCQHPSDTYLYLGHADASCAPAPINYLSVNDVTNACISTNEHIFQVQLVSNNGSVGPFWTLQPDISGILRCNPLIMSTGHFPIYKILNEVNILDLPRGSVTH